MKMRVVAVTNNWTGVELSSLREAHSEAPYGFVCDAANAAVEKLREQRGRIVHLECGHEFQVPIDALEPSYFDCRYCLQVQTIEEKDRDDRRRHEAEGRLR